MVNFVLRRVLGAVPQLLAVSMLVFTLIQLAPGEYCNRFLEGQRGSSKVFEQCRHELGHDLPAVARYGRWLGRALGGDLGYSYETSQRVTALLADRAGNTLALALTAMALTWTVALGLGMYSAWRPHTWPDRLAGLLAFTGLSFPTIVLALLALMFAFETRLFPIGDVVGPEHDSMGLLGRAADRAWHLCLPAAVIAFTSMAGYLRQMRSSMIETLTQDYVRTARAKGLSERGVVLRHAFRNAVNPLITLFGYSLGFLLSGSFIVEFVMNWPGMARLTFNAIQSHDEPLVMGAVMMANVLLIAGNLVADLLLAAADPRIRLEGR